MASVKLPSDLLLSAVFTGLSLPEAVYNIQQDLFHTYIGTIYFYLPPDEVPNRPVCQVHSVHEMRSEEDARTVLAGKALSSLQPAGVTIEDINYNTRKSLEAEVRCLRNDISYKKDMIHRLAKALSSAIDAMEDIASHSNHIFEDNVAFSPQDVDMHTFNSALLRVKNASELIDQSAMLAKTELQSVRVYPYGVKDNSSPDEAAFADYCATSNANRHSSSQVSPHAIFR